MFDIDEFIEEKAEKIGGHANDIIDLSLDVTRKIFGGKRVQIINDIYDLAEEINRKLDELEEV